jgi:lipopolysaccharide biosynthesis glycosyltransferase
VQELSICYVGDPDILFASVVSAISVRRLIPPTSADCILFVITEKPQSLAKLGPLAERYALTLVPIDPGWFQGYNKTVFSERHQIFHAAALGRLFIHEFLPRTCNKFLYLDGDTLAHQGISLLLKHHLPLTRIATAEDMMSFCREENSAWGDTVRAYFSQLGISESTRYFNSGVIVSTTDT